MAEFATFLKAVEAKYGATGELPDPTPKKQPTPRQTTLTPTAADLRAKITNLKSRLDNREALDRAALAAELKPFEKLPKPDLANVMRELNFPKEITPRDKAVAAIVEHILSPHTADARAGV